jgi:hypothetical protein
MKRYALFISIILLYLSTNEMQILIDIIDWGCVCHVDHWQPSSWVHMLDKTLVHMKIERNCIQMDKRQWRTKLLKFSSGAKALVVSLNTWQAKHETSFWCIWYSQGCIFYPLSLGNQGATQMFQIVINGLYNLHPMERYMVARVEMFSHQPCEAPN